MVKRTTPAVEAGLEGNTLHAHAPSGQWAVGDFLVTWDAASDELAKLTVTHSEEPSHVLWQSLAGKSFVQAAEASLAIRERNRSYSVRTDIRTHCPLQVVEAIVAEEEMLTVSGRLAVGEAQRRGPRYTLRLWQEAFGHLAFDVRLTHEAGTGRGGERAQCNTLVLRYASAPEERFYGFGEQLAHVNLKGCEVPILVQEQGIGLPPEAGAASTQHTAATAGGDRFATYAVAPQYVSSLRRCLFLQSSEYALFDLRRADEARIHLFAAAMRGRILYGRTLLDLIERYTEYAGRMPPLPDWLNQGAVVGMQGGTAAVQARWAELQAAGTPVAAFWLQDWVGKRATSFGSQLWWNWELDDTAYAGWADLERRLRASGVRLLGYVNSMLVDAASKPDVSRNLFAEAKARGYLLRLPSGEPYLVNITDFPAAIVDLTDADAYAWLKAVIKDQLLGVGLSGWMADFAESFPYDAAPASGIDAATYHNLYPEDWARLNREAIQEAGLEGEAVFFTRSGFTRSPGYSTLFWEGDQMVTWDGKEGFKTAIKGLLSSGFSGFSLNHSDIGGFFSVVRDGVGEGRSKELLLRWMEVNAFTAVFRTHEGIQPWANAQFYTDDETLAHFTRFAKVYRLLAVYRQRLMHEAATKGYPLVRHPILHFSDDAHVLDLEHQFMLGDVFMVAPVLDPGATAVQVYLPAGAWRHVWSDACYDCARGGGWHEVPAPLGEPPVLFRAGDEVGEAFANRLRGAGLVGH